MSKQKWEVKTHEEKPNWGTGDFDEYYEIVNERGDAFQATDYEGLEQLADALNGYEGEIRISTALEINLHNDNQLLKMENEHLKDVLHTDQTGLAAGLAEVNKIVERYRWVTEGRGPYAWNDDKYKEEMGNMLDNISEAATKALNSSGVIAHSVCCGKEGRTATMEGIGYIKKDAYDKEVETLKSENERMRKALDLLVELKAYKDKHGKDEFYESRQPLAWERAAEAIKTNTHG